MVDWSKIKNGSVLLAGEISYRYIGHDPDNKDVVCVKKDGAPAPVLVNKKYLTSAEPAHCGVLLIMRCFRLFLTGMIFGVLVCFAVKASAEEATLPIKVKLVSCKTPEEIIKNCAEEGLCCDVTIKEWTPE